MENTAKTFSVFIDKLNEKALVTAINSNLNALLIGETGTGKTSVIYELGRRHKKQVIRVNLNGQTGPEEILGKWLINGQGTYWIDGPLTSAMKSGDWVVFDEINLAHPEVLAVLNSLLDFDRKIFLKEKNNELIECHPDFRFFATANPSTYSGTKEFNMALMSRFAPVLYIDYSPRELEIIAEQSGAEVENIKHLLTLAEDLRQAKKNGVINYSCSTRDLINAGQLIAAGFEPMDAVRFTIINKAEPDEQQAIEKIAGLIFGKSSIEITRNGKKMVFSDIDAIKAELEKSIEYQKTSVRYKYSNKRLESVARCWQKIAESTQEYSNELQEMVTELNQLTSANKPAIVSAITRLAKTAHDKRLEISKMAKRLQEETEQTKNEIINAEAEELKKYGL